MIKSIVHSLIPDANQFIVGYANLHGLLSGELQNYPYGIVIGKKCDDDIIHAIVDGPTLAYYQHYLQINDELTLLSRNIAQSLHQAGVECMTIAPTITKEEREDEKFNRSLRSAVSHKMIATRAGLGWIGKSDLFISKKFGPRLRLVSVLIDYPVSAEAPPVDKSRCGKCSICVQCCPAQAANGKLWNIRIERHEFFDAQKCRQQCKIFGADRLALDRGVCGICIAVCPVGKKDKQKIREEDP